MADRVAIIGGSTAGRDHFPFPLGDFGGSMSTSFLSLTLAQFAWMFYRVKKWRVHGSATRTPPFPGSPQSYSWDWQAMIGDGAGDPEGIDPSILTRESDLVLSPTINSNDNMGDPDGGNVGIQLFDSVGFDSTIRCRIFASLFSGAIGEFISTVEPGTPTATPIVGKIVIQGVDATLIFYRGISSSTFSGTFTIEPSEYWPYATKAGDPVYDTSTGAQLADPFS